MCIVVGRFVLRMSAHSALEHEWMVEAEHSAKDVDLLQSMAADLRRRNYSNKLLRIMVAACLDEIEEIDLDVVKEAFPGLDAKGTGFVDEAAICSFLVLNSNIQQKYDREQRAKALMDVIWSSVATATTSSLCGHRVIVSSQSVPIDVFERVDELSLHRSGSRKAVHCTTDGHGDGDGVVLSIEDPGPLMSPQESDGAVTPLALTPSDRAMNHYHSVKRDSKQLRVRFAEKEAVDDGDGDGDGHDEEEEKEKENEDEDPPQKYLSTELFKQIMAKSPGKRYRVDDVVEELDPEHSGQISFAAIAKYSGLLRTVSASIHSQKMQQ